MISSLFGKTLPELESETVEVNIGNIGYSLTVPKRSADVVFDNLPSERQWYVHHHQRQESDQLFGFESEYDRNIFRQLIKIQKVGPSAAIALLNEHNWAQIGQMTVQEMAKIKGIGPKLAAIIHEGLHPTKKPKAPRKKKNVPNS